MNSHAVTWEATYRDGRLDRERDGVLYGEIDRNSLSTFRLVTPGEILVELPARDGRSGHNLVYRRRTIHSNGQKQTWFIVGWMPMGPVVAFQPETEQVMKAEKFQPGAGPLGMVQPTPEEKWFNSHRTDLRLKQQKITLPSGYVLGV